MRCSVKCTISEPADRKTCVADALSLCGSWASSCSSISAINCILYSLLLFQSNWEKYLKHYLKMQFVAGNWNIFYKYLIEYCCEFEFYEFIILIHEFLRILKCHRILKMEFVVMSYNMKLETSLTCKPTNKINWCHCLLYSPVSESSTVHSFHYTVASE